MKERLTGAIILVALIVLLVPELLTGPIRAKPAAASSASAPLPPIGAAQATHAQPPLRTYTLTLSAAPQPAHAVASTPAPAAAQPAASPASHAPANAASSVPTQVTPTATGSSHRGTSGSPDRPDLQAAKSAAHRTVPDAHSSASGGGWVVQLGSFASRRNADRLAGSLKSRGFRMSVSAARAGTRTLWRVRAGPAHDRAGAEHLAARLRALGHRGELLPVR